MTKLKELLKILGPGLLMAGAAIGVSHLMQSTRAGADYGWQLIWVVFAVNAIKYPFFQFGHRYTVNTGQNLLEGYLKLGKPYLIGFLILNTITAIISIAGVTFVTAALAENLLGSHIGPTAWSLLLMLSVLAIIMIGHYHWLDVIMKVLMVVLVLATGTALVMAVVHGSNAAPGYVAPSAWSYAAVPFLVALLGWMPAPIELSVWQSLWIKAKQKNDGKLMSRREAKIDFNTGYILTTILAMVFVALGALVMFGTGTSFANAGQTFAAQLVDLYGSTIGPWSKPIVALAAFATMYSTTLTVIDAYPRSISVGVETAFPKWQLGSNHDRKAHYLTLVICCFFGLVIIYAYTSRLKDMIDLVTTIAFLSAPPFALLNYKLVTTGDMPDYARPGPLLRAYCWFSVALLTALGVLYLVVRFFPQALA